MPRKPTGRPPGRPPFQLTDKVIAQIEQLAGYGLTLGQIAAVIGVSERTLTQRQKDEVRVSAALAAGKAKAQGIVGKALFKRAQDGDVAAIRWWEMTRAGRSEKTTQDVNLRTTHEEALDALE